MRRGVKVGHELDVIAQGIVCQLLQLGGGEGIGLDNGRSAAELEMPLELEGEAVDLEKGRLPERRFENVQVLEMMGIVPINDAQFQVGPILELAFRELEAAISRGE